METTIERYHRERRDERRRELEHVLGEGHVLAGLNEVMEGMKLDRLLRREIIKRFLPKYKARFDQAHKSIK